MIIDAPKKIECTRGHVWESGRMGDGGLKIGFGEVGTTDNLCPFCIVDYINGLEQIGRIILPPQEETPTGEG